MSDSPWFFRTVIYQIYPRSFQDSNGDGIGDIPGIISRLDYLQDLGVETLWFSPFFASPQRDFGYDVTDYRSVAPEYGTAEDAERLIDEVHRRGMKIVFDFVLNHTSDEHRWFAESRTSHDNPKSDWYIWQPGRGKKPPTNWSAAVGGSGWHYVAERDEWYFASFLPFQPDLNYYNPEVKEATFDTVRYWLDKGVDGFRLDIFNCVYKDDQFRDNPFGFRYIPKENSFDAYFEKKVHTANHPDNFVLARELRTVTDEFDPPRFTIGEVFGENDVIRRYLGEKQDGLNLAFLFKSLMLKLDAREVNDFLLELEEHYPTPMMPVMVYSNHDRRRGISRFGGDVASAKLAALLQLTMRAVPVLYYGEEIGMPDGDFPAAQALDPIGKKFRWVPHALVRLLGLYINRDGARTPMRWSEKANGDFCSDEVKPWLPSVGLAGTSVEAQREDAFSLLGSYRKLLHLRRECPALHKGEIKILGGLSRDLVAYDRIEPDQVVTVALNFGRKRQVFACSDQKTVLFATDPEVQIEKMNLNLPPRSGAILKSASN